MRNNSRFTQTGRSMIEMLGVLAIIGVLSVGGIAGYSKAMMKHRVNKTIDQISMMSTEIRTLFANDSMKYTSMLPEVLKKAKVIPEEMINGNEIKNAFGGDVDIERSERLATDNLATAFVITYTGIPPEACIALVTQNWGDSSSLIAYGDGSAGEKYINDCESNVEEGDITIGGRTNYFAVGVQCAKDGPMSVANATTLCGANDRLKTITWKFY